MKVMLIIPIGVTKETIEKISTLREIGTPNIILSITVKGFENIKKSIVEGLKIYSSIIGADYEHLILEPWSSSSIRMVYEQLLKYKPDRVVLVGVTGSRHLIFLLLPVLLKYWREVNAEIQVIHGVEGEQQRIEPLVGYVSTFRRFTEEQKKLLEIIYGSPHSLSGKQLIKKYGLGRSVYKVLANLEKKGLIRVRRGRIEKTFPGMLVYELFKVGGDS